MKIFTVTLCPAIDLHLYVNALLPQGENIAASSERNAGGKGLNVSRALFAANIYSKAYIFLGRENSRDFERLIQMNKTNYTPVYHSGFVRENVTVHESSGAETKISADGNGMTEKDIDAFEEKFIPEISSGDIVVFAGRFPASVSHERVIGFFGKTKAVGARIIVDSSSLTVSDIKKLSPYLSKPNERETEAMLGRSANNFESAVEAAQTLYNAGAENAIISLGEKGAVLACANGVYAALPPKISALSTVGAGDAAIAGFVAAQTIGETSEAALRRAVAFGTATCLTGGTNPPTYEDIRMIYSLVKTEKVI